MRLAKCNIKRCGSLLGNLKCYCYCNVHSCTSYPAPWEGRFRNVETGASAKSCLIFHFFFGTHRGLLSIYISLQLDCSLFEAKRFLISGPSTSQGTLPRKEIDKYLRKLCVDRTAGAGSCAPPPFLMKAALPIGLNLDIEPLQRWGRLGVSKGGDSLCWDSCLYKKRER